MFVLTLPCEKTHEETALKLHALQSDHPTDFPFLFQSSAQTGWDILMAFPEEVRLFKQTEAADFLAACEGLPCGQVKPVDPDLAFLPFRGGWFFYSSYELLHALEPSIVPWKSEGEPCLLGALARVECAFLWDRTTHQLYALAPDEAAGQRLSRAWNTVNVAVPKRVEVCLLEEESESFFLEGVAAIQRYIQAGDVFQVNLSRAWHATLKEETTPAMVYGALRQANPAPFSTCCYLGTDTLISSSPERLLKVLPSGKIETRPIAGTHPRSLIEEEDVALKAALQASLKERAEHIMLVDLERNDLGRMCETGSVQVEALMDIVSYAHVHHIESTVSGQLKPNQRLADLLRAFFPGGTITGCPKVRTMQIIRELESSPRGAYTGSLGYLNRDGTLDSNILIRTFIHQKNQLHFRAGAGIVVDSDPKRELAETRAKARGLLKALGFTL